MTLSKVISGTFIFFAFSFCLSAADTSHDEIEVRGIIDGLINDTINALVEKLPDDVIIESIALPFNSSVLNGSMDLSNLTINGLNTLVASKIDTTLLPVTANMTLNISNIEVGTGYGTSLNLFEFLPFHGNGTLNASIYNISIFIYGGLNITDGMRLKNSSFAFTLGDALFSFSGIMNDTEISELLSDGLTEIVAVTINKYKDEISKIISPIAEKIINSLLNGESTDSLTMHFNDIFNWFGKFIYKLYSDQIISYLY